MCVIAPGRLLHEYEAVLITLMLLAWAYVAFYFPQIPMATRGFGVLALFGWIIYAFRLIEPEGETLISRLPDR